MQKLIAINLETGHWQEASKAQLICEVNWDAMTRLTESTALVVGKGMSAAETLYKIKIQRPECSEVIRKLIDDDGFEGVYSTPETLCIPSKGSPEDLWISVDAI